MDGAQVSSRLFDIALMDRTVQENFDVVRAAGGTNRAVIREFNHVMLSNLLKLELRPKSKQLTDVSVPILSGLEVIAEPR